MVHRCRLLAFGTWRLTAPHGAKFGSSYGSTLLVSFQTSEWCSATPTWYGPTTRTSSTAPTQQLNLRNTVLALQTRLHSSHRLVTGRGTTCTSCSSGGAHETAFSGSPSTSCVSYRSPSIYAFSTRFGEVQAWVIQNITFSRLPSGKRLARTRMRSDGDDLGGKGRANSPP